MTMTYGLAAHTKFQNKLIKVAHEFCFISYDYVYVQSSKEHVISQWISMHFLLHIYYVMIDETDTQECLQFYGELLKNAVLYF